MLLVQKKLPANPLPEAGNMSILSVVFRFSAEAKLDDP